MRLLLSLFVFSVVSTALANDWNGIARVWSSNTSGMQYSPGKDRIYGVMDHDTKGFWYMDNVTTFVLGMPYPDVKPFEMNLQNQKNTFQDLESIAYGPCTQEAPEEKCLFLADIGDNFSKRTFLTVYVVRESEINPDPGLPIPLLPWKTFSFSYADVTSQDAEGLAIDPTTGDLYVVSKGDFDTEQKIKASLYKIPYQTWKNNTVEVILADKVLDITVVSDQATLGIGRKTQDLLSGVSDFFGGDKGMFGGVAKKLSRDESLITDLDISEDGSKFLFTSYNGLYEVNKSEIKEVVTLVQTSDVPYKSSIESGTYYTSPNGKTGVLISPEWDLENEKDIAPNLLLKMN